MKNLSYKLFFKAFANKTRFELIHSLREGKKSVTELVNETGFEQSRVSHNLKCLIDCGFVENNRKGKRIVYSLNKKTVLPLLNLIDAHIGKYSQHLVECGILEKGGADK